MLLVHCKIINIHNVFRMIYIYIYILCTYNITIISLYVMLLVHCLKQTWCMINNVLCRSKSDSISNSFIINGEEINDPQIIADNFNDFFINVGGPQLINSDSQYKKYLNGDVCSNFKFELVTNEQIIQIIEGLKSKRSSGYDGLSSILLKQN